MNTDKAKKVFPKYFDGLKLPEEAIEQEISVYRACPTRKVERASFLNTYEENGFRVLAGADPEDIQQYALSAYTKLKDVKRFTAVNGKYQPPMVLAKGRTTKEDGRSCLTKEWKSSCKNSHVDWWLYEGAEPWLAFTATTYEQEAENGQK